MNSINFESLWKLMSEYTFEAEAKIVDDSVTCFICGKLMIDACRSVCGCQYCYNCISNYLAEGNKYCPGDGAKCHEENLILDIDVVRDRRINNKISKLKIKCPNDSCQFTMEFSEMEDHLRLCSKQSVPCPYSFIGCDKEGASRDTLLTHLNDDTLGHIQLLLEWITNLKNDIGLLKDTVNANKLEIGYLREESSLKDNRIQTLEQELEKLKCKIDIQSSELIEPEIVETQVRTHGSAMGTSNYLLLDIPHSGVDFIWTVEEYLTKRGSSIFSDSFYSNGYKLCLSFFIYGDSIGLNCVLLPGENDEKLEWPMMCEVTLAIVDQSTMKSHKSMTFHYNTYSNKFAFNRPKIERSNFIGLNPFIAYSDIRDNRAVTVNGSLVVSCVLSDSGNRNSLSN